MGCAESDRKRLEALEAEVQTLKSQLGFYRRLVQNAASVIMTLDLDGNVTFINRSGLELFGYTLEELFGRNVIGLLVPETESTGRDLAAILRAVLAAPDQSGRGENENIRKDGTRVWMRWHNKGIRDDDGTPMGVLCIGQDISEQREAEQALRESESRYRLLADNAADIIWTMDNEQNYTYVSPSVRRVLGYEPEELPAIPREERFPMESLDIIKESIRSRAAIAKMRGATPLVREMRQKRKDGVIIWTEVVSTPICDEDGICTGFVGVTRDITERKRLEQIKEDFDRIMQHDLKGPLSGIITLPQMLLLERTRPEEEVEMLEAIHYAGRKMFRLVDASLKLHKIESGGYEQPRSLLNLMRELENVRSELSFELKARNIDLQILFDQQPAPADKPVHIMGDEVLLPFLLSNLIKNGVEAAPAGSTVSVSLSPGDPFVIRIHNQGRVPKDIESTFFDKFSTSGKPTGTGLGTFSAKLVAKAHGGTISMMTSESEGTTVTVSLPQKDSPNV